MEASLRILMEGLIDYAGLFPPASLDMETAVRNYAAYRKGGEAAWLGRLVLPVARLGEFSRAAARLAEDASGPGPARAPWRLSILTGADPADLAAILAFNRQGSAPGGAAAVIDALEMKAERAEDILRARQDLPPAITPYFEIPLKPDPAPLLRAVAEAGARAKVRTGGVTPELIPAPADLARFLAACARAAVPFKATAGLHHPVRSLRPLTYASDGPRATMHGFVNVFLGAAFAAGGMDQGTLRALLEEESLRAFAFGENGAEWRGHKLEASRLEAARREFAIAFGSCSFEEPRQDLAEAGLL